MCKSNLDIHPSRHFFSGKKLNSKSLNPIMLDQVYISFLKESVNIKVVCLEPESDG